MVQDAEVHGSGVDDSAINFVLFGVYPPQEDLSASGVVESHLGFRLRHEATAQQVLLWLRMFSVARGILSCLRRRP
jgi:hypothetical protein